MSIVSSAVEGPVTRGCLTGDSAVATCVFLPGATLELDFVPACCGEELCTVTTAAVVSGAATLFPGDAAVDLRVISLRTGTLSVEPARGVLEEGEEEEHGDEGAFFLRVPLAF